MRMRITNNGARPYSTDIEDAGGEQIRENIQPGDFLDIDNIDPYYLNQDDVLRREAFLGRITVEFLTEADDVVPVPGSGGPTDNNVGWRYPARAATTGNIPLSGLQTIDGVSLAVGDLVLVKNQTSPAENGLYQVASGSWTRSSPIDAGTAIFVSEGAINGDTGFLLATDAPIVLGTTPLTWIVFAGGSGSSFTANEFTVAKQFKYNDLSYTGSQLTTKTIYEDAARLLLRYTQAFSYTGSQLDSITMTRASDSAVFTKTFTYTGSQLTAVDLTP